MQKIYHQFREVLLIVLYVSGVDRHKIPLPSADTKIRIRSGVHSCKKFQKIAQRLKSRFNLHVKLFQKIAQPLKSRFNSHVKLRFRCAYHP